MLNPLIQAALLSITPVIELRGGIPVAVAQGASVVSATIVSICANILAILIVYLFMDFVHHLFMRIPFYKTHVTSYLERTQKKMQPYVDRWGYVGLAIFVAVPLPGTGAYTGTVAAWLLGMSRPRASVAIGVGVVVAGIAVGLIVALGSAALRAVFLG